MNRYTGHHTKNPRISRWCRSIIFQSTSRGPPVTTTVAAVMHRHTSSSFRSIRSFFFSNRNEIQKKLSCIERITRTSWLLILDLRGEMMAIL
ncbi:hypothetical protein L1987_61577 [Smallanthus sonchifolius]|uniref:Uncharacterized protein n=1 Tax=Smallanthus sonchifolius TaxID=185202 RepID=A0ACB9C8A4_9ASTR|nr:hypothetical protein L1987_61577 [Smallanthus sonchifolius]